MNVAICGNYNNTFGKIELFLSKYSRSEHKKIRTDKFTTGRELIANMASGEDYSLIFLCSEEKAETLCDISEYIREQLKNRSAAVVYISEGCRNIEEIFKYRPLDFIQYPVTEEKIFRTLKLLEETGNGRGECFKVKNKAEIRFVPYGDIIYVTSKERKITLVTGDKSYSCYGRLDEFKGVCGFVSVHKSYCVNLNHIRAYSYKRLEMTNGDIIPISQSLRPYIRELMEGL